MWLHQVSIKGENAILLLQSNHEIGTYFSQVSKCGLGLCLPFSDAKTIFNQHILSSLMNPYIWDCLHYTGRKLVILWWCLAFSFLRKLGKLAENIGTVMSTHWVIIGLNNAPFNAIDQKQWWLVISYTIWYRFQRHFVVNWYAVILEMIP